MCEKGWEGEHSAQGSSWDGEKVRHQCAMKKTMHRSGHEGNKGKGGGKGAECVQVSLRLISGTLLSQEIQEEGQVGKRR